MNSWMLMKKEGEKFFKIKDYQKACDRYKDALADIESKFGENSSELKVEAAKITSNISLMYFKLSKENNDEVLLLQSKLYAKKTIKYNPEWVKGYLRLKEVCKEEKKFNDLLEFINLYFLDKRDVILSSDFQALLADIKYYTHKEIMMLSPSWDLLRFKDNVRVIDPQGAGHYKSFQEFFVYHEASVQGISVLIRPGIYIGSYFLANADIDIVGDCEVEINSTTKAIDRDPKVVFKNTVSPISWESWIFQQLMSKKGLINNLAHTFYFNDCKVSIRRISVHEQILHHRIHAIFCINTEIKLIECSFHSTCNVSLSCSDKSKVRCKRCRSVGSYGGVIITNKSYVKLTDCFISETIGMGIEAREETEHITLKNCTITKCKKQGITVYNGSKSARILDCVFEANCSELAHEGSIQLKSCIALVKRTCLKNQTSIGIVIENGSGNFHNVVFENCATGILVQANVEIKDCVISNSNIAGISICESIKGSVVLENNTITNCRSEISSCETSPIPIFKGDKKHKIQTFNNKHKYYALINILAQYRNKPEAICDFCGYSEQELHHKLKICGKCKTTFFCSSECQEKGWKFHKRLCKPVSGNSSTEKQSK